MSKLLLVAAFLFVPIPPPGATQDTTRDTKRSPVGIWKRIQAESKGRDVLLKITSDKLTWACGQDQVEASYGLIKDNLLYGAVTDTCGLNDQRWPYRNDPFSFRFQVDRDELTVKDIRGVSEPARSQVVGKYKRIEKTAGSPGRPPTGLPPGKLARPKHSYYAAKRKVDNATIGKDGELTVIAEVEGKGFFRRGNLRIVNRTAHQMKFATLDSHFYFVQEGLDRDGRWKPFEGFPGCGCGFGKSVICLEPNEYLEFDSWVPKGEFKTKIRFRFEPFGGYPPEAGLGTMYSNEFEYSIDPTAFVDEKPH